MEGEIRPGIPRLPNFRGIRTDLYVVETYEGQGTKESPGRIVSWVVSEDGDVLGHIDPCKQSNGEEA